jgi:hypothetical protein
MMRVEFDYRIMHHCRFRVTNRVSLERLQASPEIQVVTLNPARTFFAGPAPHLSEPLQQAIIISDTQPSEEDSGSGQSTIIDTRHPFFATQPLCATTLPEGTFHPLDFGGLQ